MALTPATWILSLCCPSRVEKCCFCNQKCRPAWGFFNKFGRLWCVFQKNDSKCPSGLPARSPILWHIFQTCCLSENAVVRKYCCTCSCFFIHTLKILTLQRARLVRSGTHTRPASTRIWIKRWILSSTRFPVWGRRGIVFSRMTYQYEPALLVEARNFSYHVVFFILQCSGMCAKMSRPLFAAWIFWAYCARGWANPDPVEASLPLSDAAWADLWGLVRVIACQQVHFFRTWNHHLEVPCGASGSTVVPPQPRWNTKYDALARNKWFVIATVCTHTIRWKLTSSWPRTIEKYTHTVETT